ncbi:Hypothetical predicted protein [Octopus vulgaris]|uniref:Uncharacterized protein n=1 Tax=Octopus vulgaris TaxID=6645 RepID=A0AA36EYX7_OCTVU|nr:Hypothetical predicted protein [Octopus vulgaris]
MNSTLSLIFLGIYMMNALTEAGELACRYDCKAELKSKDIALSYNSMEKCYREEHCKCRYNCYYTYFRRGILYQYEGDFLDRDNINLLNDEVNVNSSNNIESHTQNKHKSIEEKNLVYKLNNMNENSKQIANKYENVKPDKINALTWTVLLIVRMDTVRKPTGCRVSESTANVDMGAIVHIRNKKIL